MEFCENHAKIMVLKRIIVDAREGAVAYDKSMDYKVESETYLLFGTIQHYRMVKDIHQ
jgi:hypothetical protein